MRLACEARAEHVPLGKPLPYLAPQTTPSPLRIRLLIQYTLLFYYWTPYLHPYLTSGIIKRDKFLALP